MNGVWVKGVWGVGGERGKEGREGKRRREIRKVEIRESNCRWRKIKMDKRWEGNRQEDDHKFKDEQKVLGARSRSSRKRNCIHVSYRNTLRV